MHSSRSWILLAAAATIAAATACGRSSASQASAIEGGDAERGKAALARYGCPACHTIPGIQGATAMVGPPLTQIAVRHYLGGHLQNTPANMVRWIQHPQQIDPKNAMPELGVTDQDAKDIVAYLYTLK
jgi:cytochrome c